MFKKSIQLVKKGFNYVKENVVKVGCAAVAVVGNVFNCVKKNAVTVGCVAVAVVVCVSDYACAALDLSAVVIDTSQVLVLAGIIVTAIAGIWAVKKVIKLANRS